MAFMRSWYQKIFVSSKLLLLVTIAGLLLNIGNWFIIYLFIKPSDLPIILHYNIYFGPDLIGEWYRAFLLPASGSAILLSNIFFSFFTKKSSDFFNYFLLISAGVMQIILLLASFFIIQQNI